MKILCSRRGFLVLEKPDGFEVQSTHRPSIPNLVDNWAEQNDGEVLLPVHRLDVRASGAVVLARRPNIARVLSEAFRNRQVVKSYRVRLAGDLFEKDESPIRVSASLCKRDGRAWIDPDGKSAVSFFSVLQRKGGWTDAEVKTETGRFHQVRAHAAFLGTPVLGDVRYGAPSADRLYLHARELKFPDPEGDGWINILCPEPWSV